MRTIAAGDLVALEKEMLMGGGGKDPCSRPADAPQPAHATDLQRSPEPEPLRVILNSLPGG